jgi:hypothetical protein
MAGPVDRVQDDLKKNPGLAVRVLAIPLSYQGRRRFRQ